MMQNPLQTRFLVEIAAGRTLTEAAGAVGLNRSTVFRQRQASETFDHDVRQALAEGQRDRRRRAKANARARRRKARVVVPADRAPRDPDVRCGVTLPFGKYEHWTVGQAARFDLRYCTWLLARLPRDSTLRESVRDAVIYELGREIEAERAAKAFEDLA